MIRHAFLSGCAWLLVGIFQASCAFALVNTGNILVNPGGESGVAPWQLGTAGPDSTVAFTGPLSLPNGLALIASEGTRWFGADVTFLRPAGQPGFNSTNIASIRQLIDVRPYAGVQSVSVAMNITAAGIIFSGDSAPSIQPVVVLFYQDAASTLLGVKSIGFGPGGNAQQIELQSGTALGMSLSRSNESIALPAGTAFINAIFTNSIGVGPSSVESQVRVAAGIDSAFLSLSVVPLMGDYNLNGTVDAADYVVWRNTIGLEGPGLAADGNENNLVETGDYGVWRSRFGTGGGAASIAADSIAVPEPGCLWLLLSAVAGFASFMADKSLKPARFPLTS